MNAGTRSPEVWDWREIASLGEQLISTNSIAAQRDRIISMTRRLVDGRVDVWLHENLFRLPDWKADRLFPSKPRLDGMRLAIAKRRVYIKSPRKRSKARKAIVAVPMEDQGFVLGALQITRPKGPGFQKEEIELIETLASVIAVGLYASHRVEVERFRLGQLNLVRQVSAQIASVLNLDELSRRVTELIQKTFNYYYVAIFTVRPGTSSLRFRASAASPGKSRKTGGTLVLDVDVGQGLIGQVAASGERIFAPDVRAESRYRFIHSLPETRSEVVIPLKIEDRCLGVLDVQSDRLNAFHPNDLLVLEALADNIARAVEGARLYGDLRRRADQLTLVSEVSKVVTSTLDLDSLMKEAASLVHQRFKFPYVHLFTVHPNRRLIEFEAGSGKRSHALEGYTILLDDAQGIIPWVAREGKTVLANDVSQEARYRPSPLFPKSTRAELCIPLLYGEKVVGILDIQSDKLNAFSEDDQVMFEAVAGTVAAAIRNADLYSSEQWRRRVSDSLQEVAGLLSSDVGVDEVLEAILTELERNLPVEVSAIWLMNEGDLHLAAVHGVDGQLVEEARQADSKMTDILQEVMISDTPLIRKPTDPIWPSGQAAGFEGTYSSLAAPLRIGDQSVGIISLSHHAPGRYGHEAQAMVMTFAGYAAVAIENARLYDTAQDQAYASAALLQVAQAVASLSDLDEILGTIVRIMPILAGVERVVLFLWEPVREVFRAVKEFGFSDKAAGVLLNREFKQGEFPLLDVTRLRGQIVTYTLGRKEVPERWLKINPLAVKLDQLQSGHPSLYSVPLSIKAELFGVMLIEEAKGGSRFSTRWLEIINGIAQQAALAIQSDRLQQEVVSRERLETEVQLARQIQQAFIPETLPQHPAWDLAARWKTARQVGGDFYDVIELSNHRIGFFIADVADKGIPAALFMALTRTLIRAAVAEDSSPAEALRHVNELLIPDTRQGMFVTGVYAVLDQETGELTYANAGHNPPLWLHSSGQMERLTRTGLALGVVESNAVLERNIRLAPGDSLLLYTDGLTESFSQTGEMFGEVRLMEAIRSASPSADGMLDAIEARLGEFIGSSALEDDLTMLAVHRK